MERKCLRPPHAVSPIGKSMERVPVFYPEPPHYNPAGNEYDYVPRKYSVAQYMNLQPMKDDKGIYGCMASKKR